MASIISAGTTDSTSLNISGDKTGILQLASNNAVTAVTIDASQNVGIGTTSPENKLTLLKNTTAATENSYGISIQSVNTNAYTEVLLGASDAVDAGIIQTAAKNTNFTAKNLALQPQGGNVGIGTTSPGSLFDVYKDSGTAYSSSNTIAMGQWARISNPNTVSGAGVSLMFRAAASSLATIACVSTAAAYSSALTFATRNSAGDISESMRIDSSGSLCIGNSGNFGARVNITFDPASTNGLLFAVSSGTFTNKYIYFQNSGGSQIGSVSSNNGSVTYNTTSDYRIKTNVQPITGALSKVAQLKPVTYDWKPEFAEGSSQGFIAHELQAVVPDCVTGAKDAVDADGKPVYQGIDTSFLVATLTAAIQELKAINDTQAETINALTARIVALENK
jgi:hypothetical protein